MTLLHVASLYGKTKCAELLIKLGADISIITEALWGSVWTLLDAEKIARLCNHKMILKIIEAKKQTYFIKQSPIEELKSDEMKKLDQTVKQMEKRLNELNSEMCQIKEANKLLETKLNKLNSEMIQMKKTNTVLETNQSELKSEMEMKKKDTSLLEKSLKGTNTKMDKMEKDMFELKNNEGEKRE
eukprot:TRINITY_DN3687_c0_g1_i5.p2 TRINITY_DN3687_c0_g1~~TRINITY_DN3687_c0_g1_i5.p2  ORF type:complete len:185 (+),score=37.25 TRINITY_DN3687_c0_g1_i5:237-791(+)